MEKVTRPVRILIVGSGVLGGDVLDLLTQSSAHYEIMVGARRPDNALLRVNLALYTAMNLGHTSNVVVVPMDLMNVEATAAEIGKLRPDIIFNATTLHSWWVITKLPKEAYERVDRARGGVWTPMHMVLIRRLMKAVRLAESNAIVVNASYPDVVNAALAAEGLAPAVGIGNIANAVPGVRLAAAYLLGRDPASIDVRFFAHHYLSYRMPSTGTAAGAPYHLTVYADGMEVSPDDLDHETLFSHVAGRFRRIKGLAGQSVTASSATAMLHAVARRKGDVVHGPGPLGLVGGYPVRVSKNGFLVELPNGLTLDDAIDINRRCQRFDGIEAVDVDGTVHIVEESAGIMRETLGYNCNAFRPDECEDRAHELATRFAEYARRSGQADLTSA
ncbi:hypothetical protein EV130_111116 [Rhizobium azibense]|uniref:Uncharacterized protein n=1 Tax=Rhizobium azibense TaxID=1136135 RepID=A0A4R3QJH6_9HYPH|nr:hypothetical protein [Rhizobium azibense]TCU21259.1 hypothetical protein EV130_111116 [Rhizobium azibense]